LKTFRVEKLKISLIEYYILNWENLPLGNQDLELLEIKILIKITIGRKMENKSKIGNPKKELLKLPFVNLNWKSRTRNYWERKTHETKYGWSMGTKL